MALWLYLRDINGIVQIGIKGTFIIIALILIRIIFPFELSFARTIPSDHIMVFIRDTLKNEISLFTITLTVKEFLLAIWLLGIVIYGFMAIKARIDFRHFVDRLSRKDNDKVNQILSSIMSKRHKNTPFEIICSSEISIPMLYGIINPKIIIPDIYLSKNEWKFILEHEIGHYYNYDLQMILLVQILSVIYWWNPFIYLLNYVDKEFFFTSKEMHESFLGLNIYDNLEEANINEKKRQEHPILYYFTDSIHTIFSSILR